MKRYSFILFLVLLSSLSLYAQAGTSCDNAIPLLTNVKFEANAGEYWYVAESFDLPYTVFFTPIEPTDRAPEIYVDMSCPHGYSPDPKVQNHLNHGWKELFPRRLHVDTLRMEDGRPVYKCYYGEDRLQILEAYGIDYSIPVYIHLTVFGPGHAQTGDHDTGLDCQYTSHTLQRDSVVTISQDTIFRLMLSDMADMETARFIWESPDSVPQRAYFTSVCDSTLDDAILLDSMDFVFDEDSAIVLDLKHSLIASWKKHDADGAIFIRLKPSSAGTLRWGEFKFVPTCNNQSIRVLEQDTVSHKGGSILETYKLDANRWNSTAHLFEWRGTEAVRLFMADTCTFALVRTNRHVAYYHELMPGDSVIIPSKTMQNICLDYSDTYDNVYMKIRSNGSGSLVTRVVPDPPEPIPTAVTELQPATAPRQLVLKNGQILIVFNGHHYSLLGHPID